MLFEQFQMWFHCMMKDVTTALMFEHTVYCWYCEYVMYVLYK